MPAQPSAGSARQRSIFAIGLLLTTACGPSDGGVRLVTPLAAGQAVLRGHATFGHEVRTLRPCGEQDVLWAVDSTGTLWELHRELAPDQGRPERLFIIVLGRKGQSLTEGFGAAYAGSLVVDKVLYMAREGFDCSLNLRDVYYRAAGNEPFWLAEITVEGMTFRQLGGADLFGTGLRSESAASGLRYATLEGEAMSVTISDNPCRDSMSGAFYGRSAEASVSGNTLTGCALRGLAEPGS